MSLREVCVLGLVLLIIGAAVAPLKKKAQPPEKPKKTPAPPKREGQSQDDYAREILNGRDISEVDAEELPKADVNLPKYILTDDASTVEGFLKYGNFVEKFIETWVRKVEDQTAFRLTVQNFYNNFLFCVQRIRIYEELETPKQFARRLAKNPSLANAESLDGQWSTRRDPSEDGKNGQGSPFEGQSSTRTTGTAGTSKTPRRKFKETPREDILAKCEGGFGFRPHSRYRFGFADTIFFYGSHRMYYKIQDPARIKESGFVCHERSYTNGGRKDKLLFEPQCKTKIERIFAFEGTMKNLIWNLLHNPKSLLTGRAFQEK